MRQSNTSNNTYIIRINFHIALNGCTKDKQNKNYILTPKTACIQFAAPGRHFGAKFIISSVQTKTRYPNGTIEGPNVILKGKTLNNKADLSILGEFYNF